jgi:hypothetical protein
VFAEVLAEYAQHVAVCQGFVGLEVYLESQTSLLNLIGKGTEWIREAMGLEVPGAEKMYQHRIICLDRAIRDT